MSDHHTAKEGLLTNSERDQLTDPNSRSDNTRDELITQLRDRIWRAFSDIELLYMVLSENEFQEVFDDSETTPGSIRARAQHVLAFLYYGLQLADDDVAYRITSAIEEAEAANNREATVTLDIITQPFLSPEQQIQALKNGNYDQVSAEALDRLLYNKQVPPTDVVDAFAALGEEDLTVEDVVTEREEAMMLERMPSPVVTNVEVTSEPPTRDEY